MSLANLPIGILVSSIMYKIGTGKMDEYYTAGKAMNNTIIKYVNGMEMLKIFNKDGEVYGKFYDYVISYRDLTLNWVKACWPWMAMYNSILIIQMLSQYISDVLQSSSGYKIFADKRIKLGEHLRKLPMGYFTEGNIGKISSIISTDMIFIEQIVMTVIADNMGYIFNAIIMAVFMMYFNFYIGIIAIVISLIAVLVGEK